jgi:hypothetical protein
MLKNISAWAMLTASAFISPTSASISQIPEKPPEAIIQQVEVKFTQSPVTAPATAVIKFERVKLTSSPAPKPEPKPEPKVEETPPPTTTTTVKKQSAVPGTTTAETKITPIPEAAATPAPKTVAVSPGSAQAEAANQMKAYGWGADQLTCLISLWEKESNWNSAAENPSSGAFGIPQSLPGNKMASAGADWRTNPATQIKWGLGYIAERYKTPCGAWGHSVAVGWY